MTDFELQLLPLQLKPQFPNMLLASLLLVDMQQNRDHTNERQRYAEEADKAHECLNVRTVHVELDVSR